MVGKPEDKNLDYENPDARLGNLSALSNLYGLNAESGSRHHRCDCRRAS